MKSNHIIKSFLVSVLFLMMMSLEVCNGDGELKMMFYNESCPPAEDIVREITWNKVLANPKMGAKLLRLHYHDCFVRGCDASLLLDSTSENEAEKEAVPNRAVEGYEIIDEIKAKLEEVCPETVSCADIVALAARDAVSYQFQEPVWEVFTGRRDGRISSVTEAIRDLPSPFSNFTTLLKLFEVNGLDIVDLVALSGAHTIGVSRCLVFQRRIFNFTGKGDIDPSLDLEYAEFLKGQCSDSLSTEVEMDADSSFFFDNDYFHGLNQHKGLFQSDAALLTNQNSATIAKSFEERHSFFDQFAKSIVKMSAMGVLTGNDGEIRRNCSVVN